MNYVILHGTLNKIEKGEMSDGAIYSVLFNDERDTPWDYRKSFAEDAKCVLEDGNYFNEEDGGTGINWTDEKRKFVHDKWLALADLVEKQIKENGRFDIEIINYFSQDSDKSYKEVLIDKINRFINDLNNDVADVNSIIEIMDVLEYY